MTFEEYLQSKKIDSKLFETGEPERWRQFKFEFDQMHPKSFTAQKLFLINAIRHSYPLKQDVLNAETTKVVQKPRPKMAVKKPALKPNLKSKPKIGKPVIRRPKRD